MTEAPTTERRFSPLSVKLRYEGVLAEWVSIEQYLALKTAYEQMQREIDSLSQANGGALNEIVRLRTALNLISSGSTPKGPIAEDSRGGELMAYAKKVLGSGSQS